VCILEKGGSLKDSGRRLRRLISRLRKSIVRDTLCKHELFRLYEATSQGTPELPVRHEISWYTQDLHAARRNGPL